MLVECLRHLTDLQATPPELPAGVDWESVFEAAARHGVSAMVGRSLRHAELPSPLRERLRLVEFAVAQRGLHLTGILHELTKELAAAGLRVIAYKGPVLSQQLYGDPAVREAVDLDLLLSPGDVRGAMAVLTRRGFTPLRPYPASTLPQLIRYRAEYGMVKGDDLIELQWRLAPMYFSAAFDFEAAWNRRRTVNIGGMQVATFSAEDNLLALCVHGTKHHWQQLKWVLDIDFLIRNESGLDWQAAEADAAASGIRTILLTSLATSRLLLGTPLPPTLQDAIGRNRMASMAASAFVGALDGSPSVSELEHHRTMLRLRERARDRWRYLAHLAVLPTELEWDWVALPRGLAWMYYPMRFLRVVCKPLA